MSPVFKWIIIIFLYVVVLFLGYARGWNASRKQNNGSIVITDSDDPNFEAKVRFLLHDNIEDLVYKKNVILQVDNQMSKKYSSDSGELDFKGKE